MTTEPHDYEPDAASKPHAMHADPPCRLCGSSRRSCERRGRNDLERHRFSFEGATSLLARHLIDDHGAAPLSVSPWCTGLSQGDWAALDNLHQRAHESESGS